MNRRNFFKNLGKLIVGAVIAPQIPIPIFTEFITTDKVGEFQYYIIINTKIYFDNPRHMGYINNIEIPESY